MKFLEIHTNQLKKQPMKNFKILSTLSFLLLLLAQCNEAEQLTPEDYANAIEHGKLVQGSLAGEVLDENNNPVEGAVVTLLSETTQTDENGWFEFLDINLGENHTYVEVLAPGYFAGSRSIIPSVGVNKVSIKLLPHATIGTVDSELGGAVDFNEVKIDFTGGFVSENGATYSGKVTVQGTYLNPLSEDITEIMPGSLRAAGTEGETYLKTFGMIGIELVGEGGEKLELAEGATAQIEMPIQASMQADAPAIIPLWHFDEEKGFWVEEGTAQRDGDKYIGEVSHFSFWNIDIKVPSVTSSARIVDQYGIPLANCRVTISSPNAGSRSGYTCSEGRLKSIMPANVPLELSITEVHGSSQVTVSKDIEPLRNDEDLGDIEIVVPEPLTVSGTIRGCNGELFNGRVRVNDAYYTQVENGVFSTLSYPYQSVKISLPVNMYYKHISTVVNVAGEDSDFGEKELCDPSLGIGGDGASNNWNVLSSILRVLRSDNTVLSNWGDVLKTSSANVEVDESSGRFRFKSEAAGLNVIDIFLISGYNGPNTYSILEGSNGYVQFGPDAEDLKPTNLLLDLTNFSSVSGEKSTIKLDGTFTRLENGNSESFTLEMLYEVRNK